MNFGCRAVWIALVTLGSDASAMSIAAMRPASTCVRAHRIVIEFLNEDLILFHIDCISEFPLNYLLDVIVSAWQLRLSSSAPLISLLPRDVPSLCRRPARS